MRLISNYAVSWWGCGRKARKGCWRGNRSCQARCLLMWCGLSHKPRAIAVAALRSSKVSVFTAGFVAKDRGIRPPIAWSHRESYRFATSLRGLLVSLHLSHDLFDFHYLFIYSFILIYLSLLFLPVSTFLSHCGLLFNDLLENCILSTSYNLYSPLISKTPCRTSRQPSRSFGRLWSPPLGCISSEPSSARSRLAGAMRHPSSSFWRARSSCLCPK